MAYFSHRIIIAVLWIMLAVFFALAGLAVPLAMKKLKAMNEEKIMSEKGVDFWFTARNSQPWYSVAMSVTATGAGAWLLYTPGEAAVVGGWMAVLGYCVAISLGPLFMMVYGPRMRQQCADGANITDWIYDRFGPYAHVYCCIVFIYYMFLYMSGQLKTVGDMVSKYTGDTGAFCPGPDHGVIACTGAASGLHGIIPVAVITMIYTSIGGLPASILTDQIQAIAILLIVIILSIFVFAEVKFSSAAWADSTSVWTTRGFEMGLSLCFAVFGAEVFNLAFWQRVFMAKDDRALRIGFGVGTLVLVFLTFLFGVVGLLLKAQAVTDDTRIAVPAFILFNVNTMSKTTDGIRMLLFILAVCMATSSVDSFQIGISSVLSRFMQKREVPYKKALIIGVALTCLVNIPAVIFAWIASNDWVTDDIGIPIGGLAVTVTNLFSMADIVTITVLIPVMSGLWGFTTTWGCLLGMASGMSTIIVWGWAEFGSFAAGFEMITMMCFGSHNTKTSLTDVNGDTYYACGFYSRRAGMLFASIVAVTFVVTMTVSWMQRSVRVLEALEKQQKGETTEPPSEPPRNHSDMAL